MKKKLFTVWVFARLNTRRFFRDKLALFFVILFPLIFLSVFGGITGKNHDVTFRVALVNQSHSAIATEVANQISTSKVFKVDKKSQTMDQAKEKMTRSQLDAIIVLPANFGETQNGRPTGQAKIVYTQNNEQAGQTLVTVLQGEFKERNSKYVVVSEPFTVTNQKLSNKSLAPFDYTFAGLLGFSIIGLGIFGPVNVFPELKKQGILRRLHTTPLRVWQYFTSMMISQAIIGLVSLAIMFAFAITIFHLHVVGNWFAIIVWLVLSITMILGIGLAIGGWAHNERQAAPLSNIVVFPMMFLSGTFFPRYAMPDFLQRITDYLPLSPVIDGIRLIATEGKGLTDVGPQMLIIAVWLVVVYVIAFRVFRWE
ncbi:MAG TPA: ABC transporter permease [Candidatus Saccharimonadales bacterium]|jgi:ABC-2 type transport system permease protein|nr:ABC transporter permease [Candidatus Saccharimonadales bacterium]